MGIKSAGEYVKEDFDSGFYPEDEDLQKFINRRNRWGWVWYAMFIAATVVAIVALSALLYTVVRDSFGYVVTQNEVDPEQLVLVVEEERMLNASNTVSSEDDTELVKGIEDDPHAIGYFGHSYYINNTDKLRAVSVNGAPPTEETANNGEYPYTRPLYIYSSLDVIQSKPNVSGFINYYLTNVNDVIDDVGYFSADAKAMAQAKTNWLEANTLEREGELPVVDPAGYDAEAGLAISGSSTVYPLTRELAKNFRRGGYQGGINLDQVGTSAGFEAFCKKDGIDLVNASRPIKRTEIEACQKAGREVVEFKVGTDALVVAVSQKNDFLENVTVEELREIFTDFETWSDVNAAYPGKPIQRFIPGADSGTLDFFADTTFSISVEELPAEDLLAIAEFHLSPGRVAALDAEQPLAERTQEELMEVVQAEVIKPRVDKSYNLVQSVLEREEIYAYAETVPNGYVEFRSWINWHFLTNPQSSIPEYAGIRTAIFGSLWVIIITVVVALPLGVGAAIYLEEYASMVSNPMMRRFNGIIQTNINNLAGVPSIIYGLLGLAVFVRVLEPITSGAVFGLSDATTANGRTILSGGFTLALLILPIIIINAQEAIRAVPLSLRQAGMGLGATKWQTIKSHVLPNAIPGILTGNILAMSRAIGETAPLVVIGVSTFITVDPSGPFSKFTTLPVQIYQWTSRPQDEFRNIAAAAIIILLILLLSLNAAAVLLRNRYARQLQ
jgi:phosphate transport system permease protein